MPWGLERVDFDKITESSSSDSYWWDGDGLSELS